MWTTRPEPAPTGSTSSWGTFSRLALAALLLAAAPAAAKVFVTVDEALKLAFPGCEVERRTAFLKPEQVQRARGLAGAEVPAALVNYYVARRGGQPAGTAYFDTHRVRTLPETLMIVVDPQGKVGRIEVISFREPEEYMPRGAWYQQFLGRGLDADLQLKRGIHPVTGATLTARATTDAVRRVLALHQVISP
ncbi:MAG TPA: FMN-binding protein [Thermoanaerobaculia bacterium]|nr:FMN-binding protein [Thermoanaerobaculia bacterium]